MSTIKISELANGSLSLETLMVFADENGLAFKRDVNDFKTLISTLDDTAFQGKLLIADTPVDGWYFAGESGTYTNAGSLVVDISNNIAIIVVSDSVTTFEKIDIPISITFDTTPTEGSLNAVESGGVFDSLALKLDKTDVVDDIGLSSDKGINQSKSTDLMSIKTDVTGTLTSELLNPDGTTSANGSWRTTDFIEIDADNGFLFNATAYPGQPTYATVIVYDDSDVIQEVIYSNDTRLSDIITYDYDYKIRCCARQTGGDTIEVFEYDLLKNKVNNIQTTVDNNSVVVADVESNTYLGKTITNYSFPNNGYINSSGNYTANASLYTTDFIDLDFNRIDTIFATYSFNLAVLSASAINFYDEFQTWIEADSITYIEDGIFTDREISKPANARYVRFTTRDNYLADSEVYTNFDNLKIEFESLGNPNRFYLSDVANFGDSITWYDGNTLAGNQSGGTGGGEMCIGYIQHLAKTLVFNSYDNQGASGKSMTTENWVQISAYDFSSIDLATIAHGTNDFKLNRDIGTIGSITDTTFDTDTFYGAYRTVLNAIKNSNTNSQVVLITPIQRDNSGYTIEYTNSAGFKLIDYVNAIKALGEMYSLKVIDLYGESGINFYNVFDFTIDGLHPNNAGHLKMGNSVLREIV